jgi:hypothetical protein
MNRIGRSPALMSSRMSSAGVVEAKTPEYILPSPLELGIGQVWRGRRFKVPDHEFEAANLHLRPMVGHRSDKPGRGSRVIFDAA